MWTTGCTSESVVRGDWSAQALRGVETNYGTIRMTASDGAPVHLRPGDSVTITTVEGSVTADAGRFCRNQSAIFLREDGQDCSQAARVAAWDDIESVKVEQFDGGSTATVVTVGAAAVALIMVGLAATKGDTKSGGKTAPPPVPYYHHHHHYPAYFAFGFGAGRTSSSSSYEDDSSPEYQGPPRTRPASLPSEGQDSVPLFSGRAQRRAIVRPSLRVDAGACAFSDRCFTGSARVGATFLDILDISGGVRWEQGRTDTVLATAGAGLNGTFPRLPALSVYVGTQFGFGDGFRIIPSAGLRLKPGGNVSIGILPASFTYFSPDRGSPERSRVAYTPSLELGYEF
ncbi:hypothetical protein LZC95_30405 [Pendulispora brunnea]|uniref:Uncharacterized protein n=1 Tax=Pendulispora brunnea TaxID=2905690 RepID=A0ABZ2JY88_9BACT